MATTTHNNNNNNKPDKNLQDRIFDILNTNHYNQYGMGDVRLTVSSKPKQRDNDDEQHGMMMSSSCLRVSMDVHRRVLASKSRFFAEKLHKGGTHSVVILECEDVEAYVEAMALMYSTFDDDHHHENAGLKGRLLLGMDVPKILTLLKISSTIMFDDGIRACLEYLEAIPWSEEEEESVVSHVNQLHLDSSRTNDVLQRVTSEPSTSSRADDIFLQLSLGILQGKDDKARREMKSLISRLIKEDHNSLDISRDTLYHLCHRCLSSLILCLSGATCLDENKQDRGSLMAEIAREADNMMWVVDILIDRKMGDEFVRLWADQKELVDLHSKIPIMYRHEISKITAQLCVCIGKGYVLVPREIRFGLLSTWLEALYDDFRWMIMSGRLVDRKAVEEGLCQTILTLPLPQQQSILLNWFDRFLSRGDDCPNIQKAFEIWWRRAFVKQYVTDSQLQLTVFDIPN